MAGPLGGLMTKRFVTGVGHAEVTAVVVTFNSASHIADLISDLRLAAADTEIRLIVVDNSSSDETVTILREHDDIILIETGRNLGYAGGINAALPFIGSCEQVYFLNPDLRLKPDSIARLCATATDETIGAVVPRVFDMEGTIYHSLRREPSLIGALGDALFGGRMSRRPNLLSETDRRVSSYAEAHDVDWSGGAAVLVPAAVVSEVGPWNDDFFLYSEEVEYFRRIRRTGRRIRYEPSAVVWHWEGGSGKPPLQHTLLSVNRIRYVEMFHGPAYAFLFRGAVILGEILRFRHPARRTAIAYLLNRRRWQDVMRAMRG